MEKKRKKNDLPGHAAFLMFPSELLVTLRRGGSKAVQKMFEFAKVKSLALLEDCSGPTSVEYAILLALIVFVSFGVLQVLGESWEKGIYVRLAQAIPN
jgi:Flp pilus assembly pilin Flp